MKRLFAGVAALLLALCLGGCDGYVFRTDGTLFPPVLTEQQNAIYAALRAQVPDDIQLCYPLTGSYRSAFILTDIDEEPTEEAIVFYRSALQGNRSAAVRINVLDQTAGGWVSTCDVAAAGDVIDQVDFGSFGTPEKADLMVGCRDSGTGEKTLTIYRYADGMLEGHASYGCRIFSTFRRSDEAPDGVVFIAGDAEEEEKEQEKETGREAVRANLVLWRDGRFETVSAVPLHEDVSDYAAMISGGTAEEGTALYLDGYLDGALCTQILTLDGADRLGVSFDLIEASRRTGEIYCADIDGDGAVEVPSEAEAPRFDEEAETPAYYVDWLSPKGKGFEIRETNYINFSNGYRLVVPQQWKESVAVRAVPDFSEVEFYTVQAGEEIELLRLRTVRSADIEQNVSRQGYINIASVGQITYFAKINLDTDNACRVTRETLVQRFFTLL